MSEQHEYINNFESVAAWINSQGGSYSGIQDKSTLEKLDSIARDCMKIYTPRSGDRQLLGWFIFGDVCGKGEGVERGCTADGICYIGKDGRAAIGINLAVLDMDPTYARVVVGLHELAHLSVDEHNDVFTSVLMRLQYQYYHTAAATYHRADSAEIPRVLVGRRTASL